MFQLRYGLVGTDKFSVNPTSGEVTLIQPLDREVRIIKII